MGLTLKKYTPLPDLTVQGNNYQAPNISIAPNIAPAQNISVPIYRGPGNYSWNTAPRITQAPLGSIRGGGINVGHFPGSGLVENALNAPESIAHSVQAARENDINKLQAAGQIAQSLLDSAGLVIPATKGVKLASKGGKLLPKVVAGAKFGGAYGGAYGASSAVGQGASPLQVAESTLIGTGAGALGGATLPVAGAGIKAGAKVTIKGAKAVKAYDAAQNQAGFINLSGKNVGGESLNQQENRLAKMHEANTKSQSKIPNVSADLLNLQNRYEAPVEPTNIDKIIANTTDSTPTKIANERDLGNIRIDAERQALNHLSGGGTRDEAAKLYQKATGTTFKDARYRVQRAAQSARVALKPNPETPNVLLKDYSLDIAKPGEYDKAPFNRNKVNNNLNLNHRIVTKDINKLSPNDRANFIAYKQGTRAMNLADNPSVVQKAVNSTQHLFDVAHAFDTAAGGTTRHIKDFFPDYWNYEDPNTALRLQEARVVNPHANPETSNYGGFHNKNRIFGSRQEGLDAGFQPLYTDPLEDINRYVSGAKLTIGDQAFKKAATEASANVEDNAFRHTIDLASGTSVKVDKQGNRALKNESLKAEPNILLKGYDKASRIIVQTIVANPVFHGGNQLIQTMIASGRIPMKVLGGRGQSSVLGMAKVLKHLTQYATSKEYRTAGTAEYLAEGGHIPSYGTYQKGALYKAFNSVKAGGITKTSPSAMREIERAFRVSAYKASKASGMGGLEAVKNIDHYLGDAKAMSDAAYRAGLFLHYAKTMGGSLYGHARHPVQEAGATSNALALVGIIAGLNYGWQQVTGNKDATVRAPGEIGFVEQIIKSKAQAQRGQVPSLVTNRVNPLIKYPAELASNRDFSKPVTGPSATSVYGPKGEGAKTLAGKDLLGPGQTIQRTDKGQASPAEAGLSLATGLYTPHAKGYQAAPNIPRLNSKNAKPGTGLDERNAYVKGQDTAYKVLGNNANNVDAFNSYKDKNYTPDGKSIQREPKETMTDAATLFSNDSVRKAAQIAGKANKSHDPQWDLSPDKLKTWFNYQKNVKDSAEQNYIVNHNPWIRDVQSQRNQYYDKLGSTGASVPSAFAKQNPFPLSDGEFNTMIGAAKINDPAKKSQYYLDHPELTNIDQRYGKYINAIRDNQGAPPLPSPPSPPPGIEDLIASYNKLPKNDGPKGGSKSRSLWIQSHPDAWAQITNFYTRSSLYNLVKQAAAEQLNGDAAGNQKLLKAAYSLGQYDIAKNPDGTYSLGAGGSSSSSGSSGSRGYSSSRKSHFSSSDRSGSSRTSAHFNPNRVTIKLSGGGKVSTPSISVPKSKAKVAKKGGAAKPKVALKSLRV